MPACAVGTCKNTEKHKPTDVVFFSFPHNENVAKEWVKFCGNPKLKISKSTICSAHFEKSCFIHDWRSEIYSSKLYRKMIKPNAIPSIGICHPLKDTNTNIVCEPTIFETMEPLTPESTPPLIANPSGACLPFEKIFTKDPFFINFKDNSGAFLNEIRSQSQNCPPQIFNSDLNKSPPLIENIHSGNITEDHLSKDHCTYPFKNVNHDHDYIKTNGPELHNDKGNILLTVNLTEYSKVIDVKRICGIVLVLNDQPTQNSKNNTFTNDTHGSINEPVLKNKTVSESDSINEVTSGDKSVSINKKSFDEHFRINEKGEKEFNCPKCEKMYYSPRLLRNHFKKEHDASYKYKCPKCPKVYKAHNVLQNHIKREHYMKCQFCENEYETVHHYKTHLKEDHKEVPYYKMCKPYLCDLCDKEFSNKDEFLRHLRLHGGTVCGICAERFESREEFTAHEEEHPNKYVCEICNKGFKSRESLHAHKAVHNDPIFICDICKQAFKNKGSLRNHIVEHHHKKKRYMCDKCPIRFYNPSRLVKHQRAVHDKIKPFQCLECDKKFSENSGLQLHHRIMHLKLKPFQCEFCGKQFAKKDALVNHRNIHTRTPRIQGTTEVIVKSSTERKRWNPDIKNSPVDCEICGKTLKNMMSLKAHLNTHARIRKFKCNFCGLLFLHQTSKIRHEKSHQADPEHKFVCPICWRRMKTKEELDKHIDQHNNRLKRHSCDVCGEAFCRRLLLDNHILLEHANPEEINKKEQEMDEVFQAVNNFY